MYEKHFCVIWEREGVSLLKATEEVEKKFELQETYFNYDIVNAYENFLYYPIKIENQLNNLIIYDIETFSRDRSIP